MLNDQNEADKYLHYILRAHKICVKLKKIFGDAYEDSNGSDGR